MRIGAIGLGNIGGAIAANLLEDGHDLVVHDADPARVAALVEAGAREAPDPAAVASASEISLVSLPTPEVVRGVARRWLAGATAGSVFVDLSTNSPRAVQDLGELVAEAGCDLLEAPLTGGAPEARARALVFLVGGDQAVVERCRPLLERLGRATFHVGELGCGSVAKLVNSLLAFTATWVSLEGLSLAAAAGIDLRTMVEIVRSGGAGNFYMDRMVEGIERRGRPPQFSLELAAKDARLIVDTALRLGVPTPVAAEIAQVFVQAVRAGLGERDWSDIAEFAEHQADVRFRLGPPPDPASD